jgi:predicted hotdog family 3-hydroxylacyl-ACP dehydratase
MCLLDRVLDWDESNIRCAARSHRDRDNPLREPDGLPVWAAIEYAAQAAAVHGALLRPAPAARAGLLGALRDVEARCEWLDRIDGELILRATLLHDDPAGAVYGFAAHGSEVGGEGVLLISGRFTLMLLAAPCGGVQ